MRLLSEFRLCILGSGSSVSVSLKWCHFVDSVPPAAASAIIQRASTQRLGVGQCCAWLSAAGQSLGSYQTQEDSSGETTELRQGGANNRSEGSRGHRKEGWGGGRLDWSQRIPLIKKKSQTTGFIAPCGIRKANGDGKSHPLQFSCLSFAFGIGYSAREGFYCRHF